MSKWKMVPVEPTDQMIRAIDGLICSSYLWPVYAYRAMIDAAPVQQTDPLGYFTFNKEWNVWEQMSAKYKNASDATPLYLHPPSAELARLRAEAESLTDVLRRNGFVQCDSQACNCGSWHARYGLRQRHDEIIEALAEAGHPLSNDNGNLTLNALQELVDEAARLRAENERLRSALQEIADTPASPGNICLVAVIMAAQYALQDAAPTAPPAR